MKRYRPPACSVCGGNTKVIYSYLSKHRHTRGLECASGHKTKDTVIFPVKKRKPKPKVKAVKPVRPKPIPLLPYKRPPQWKRTV